MSKYKKLWEYFVVMNKEEYLLTFVEIEKILGFAIDHSFLKYKKEALDFGYEVVKISLKNKNVFIKKVIS